MFAISALNNQRTRLKPQIVGLQEPKLERPVYQVWHPLLAKPTADVHLRARRYRQESWLGLYLCALVDHGLTTNGLDADLGNSLFVDWETDRETVEGRAWALKRAEIQTFDEGWGLRYFAAQSPLVEWIDTLADYVAGGTVRHGSH